VETARITTTAELAAEVAHEINNPLLAILGLSEFLLKELARGSHEADRVRQIHEAGLEIKQVVNELLAHARVHPDAGSPGSELPA
jgi:signal transduction histidine kinase